MSDIIDHVGIRVGNLPASRRMYEAALSELGFVVLSEGEFEGDAHVLFGGAGAGNDDFCLHTVGTQPGRDRVTTGAHIAFPAETPTRSGAGTPPPCATAGRTSARPGCVPSTRATTTRRSSSIPTATTSRPCSTRRHLRTPSKFGSP